MKHTKVVAVPATTREVVEKVTCDICGVQIRQEMYSAEEVEVRHRTGHNYPEDGSGEEVSVDMCGKCFDEKLIPWLRSMRVTPRMTEWSY